MLNRERILHIIDRAIMGNEAAQSAYQTMRPYMSPELGAMPLNASAELQDAVESLHLEEVLEPTGGEGLIVDLSSIHG
jgi:hypothetical protein